MHIYIYIIKLIHINTFVKIVYQFSKNYNSPNFAIYLFIYFVF